MKPFGTNTNSTPVPTSVRSVTAIMVSAMRAATTVSVTS